ncbi:MAG: helix-turn-helix domain-containing protein [Actinophytocola sp.]|uniref:helix-turn-helix transcriptional regulator n=1 Tax=Actinophytocola sp. TaxID=1872138 RepID=UPI00132289D7|nr:helix-turn-helix domain-containing protein [Actinophytocola sp.]MPZ82688.1 helix-turn-helix domain-containing protein [Actinophytocola sp.]
MRLSPGRREPADESYHAALASRTRRRVLDTLTRSPAPMDAQALATELGLHVTTVRFHLEQLEEAGLVRREQAGEKRRGRPRLLYTAVQAVARDEDSREQLIEALAGVLASRDDDNGQARSVDAGRNWANALVPEQADPGDRRGTLVGVLDRLGFDPEPDGEDIRLRACPFRDAAREHPQVVCSVHRGLVEQLVEPGGTHARLLPFVEPELCLITLEPRRTVS